MQLSQKKNLIPKQALKLSKGCLPELLLSRESSTFASQEKKNVSKIIFIVSNDHLNLSNMGMQSNWWDNKYIA